MSSHDERAGAPEAERGRRSGAETTEATLGESIRRARTRRHTLLETRHAPGLRLPGHSHARPTITLVLAGSFRERIDGRAHDCGPLDVLFKPAGVRHSNDYAGSGARCFVVEVTDETVAALVPDGSGAEARPWVGRSAVSALAIGLYRAALEERGTPALAVEELVAGLGEECARRGRWRGAPDAPAWLARVRDRLHADPRDPPCLARLADEAGVHPSHVCRAFRRSYGCTVTAYVRRLRIDEAVRRLASEPDADLSGLALALGYYDQSHFTRAFRRTAGGPPGRFRDSLPRTTPAPTPAGPVRRRGEAT